MAHTNVCLRDTVAHGLRNMEHLAIRNVQAANAMELMGFSCKLKNKKDLGSALG